MLVSELKKRVNDICRFINEQKPDMIGAELKERNIMSPFVYGAWCERNFEMNLREDYKRQTTFTSDFSIAEWCVGIEGMKAISETLKNAIMNFRDDIKFFAELIIVVNMKSWEHAARGNNNYGAMYSEVYYMVKDLYFDWFDESHKKHDEAIEYYYDFVD